MNTLDNPMSHENRLTQLNTLGAPQSSSDGFYLCHLPMQYYLTWESELEGEVYIILLSLVLVSSWYLRTSTVSPLHACQTVTA